MSARETLGSMIGANRSLIVDSTMRALKVVPWDRAVTLVVARDAYTLLECPDGSVVRSQNLVLPKPMVVGLSRYVPWRRAEVMRAGAKVSTVAIHVRDAWTCQYCGVPVSRDAATVDHILPRSRGGGSTWDNLCTSCEQCNNRKADRTPQEAGLPVPVIPDYSSHNLMAQVQTCFYKALDAS